MKQIHLIWAAQEPSKDTAETSTEPASDTPNGVKADESIFTITPEPWGDILNPNPA